MGAHSGSTRQNWTHLHNAERRGCKEPSPCNGVLTDEQRVSGSGHVQALVKRGVGPFRDPKHRLQERVRSCPTVWAECCKPRQGRCHKHRHQNPRILTQVSHQHHAQVLDWDFANISFHKLKGCRRHHHVTIISSSLASPLCFLCVIYFVDSFGIALRLCVRVVMRACCEFAHGGRHREEMRANFAA